MLESTQEYKDEKILAAQEKRAKDAPIDRKCLENMRTRYSEQSQRYTLFLFLLSPPFFLHNSIKSIVSTQQ